MATIPTNPYPGELATADELRLLADEYRNAAHELQRLGRRGAPLSRAPFRFSALHAIELYLNALLRQRGHRPRGIRGLQHNLALRTKLALEYGLTLRARTEAHLYAVAENREYLVARYGPELSTHASQVNRLTATLDEVAEKVTQQLAAKPQPSALNGGERLPP